MPTELGQIRENLGRVLEGVDRLREDFRTEQESARDSRAAVHRRLDEMSLRVGQVESAIAVDGHITAQVRGKVDALATSVDDSKRVVDEFRRMKAVGIGIVGLIALGGTALGAGLAWWGDATATFIRHLLRIN